MTTGGLSTTLKTLFLRTSNIITPKRVGVRYMTKVARWKEFYDDEHEVQSLEHKIQQEDIKHNEHEKSCWIPHPRTGIYYPKGHEWVMKDVPVGAARFECDYWFRNGDDDGDVV